MVQKFFKQSVITLAVLLCSTLFAATTHAAVISGTAYSDAGTTPMPDGTTVTLLQNGAPIGASTVLGNGDGTFSINTAPALISSDEMVTLYLDSGDGVGGITVTKQNGADAAIANLDIYQDHLIITHEGAAAITITELESAIPLGIISGDTDVSNLVQISGTDLELQSGKTLLLLAGKTLTANENILVQNAIFEGTVTFSSSFLVVNADLEFGAASDFSGSGGFLLQGASTQEIANNKAGAFTGTSSQLLFLNTSIVDINNPLNLGDARISIISGTVNTNDNDISTFALQVGGTSTFNVGASTFTTTNIVNGKGVLVYDSATLNAQNSSVTIDLGTFEVANSATVNHGASSTFITSGDLLITGATASFIGNTGRVEALDIELTAGSLTMPAESFLSGDISVATGTTFNANNGTITKNNGNTLDLLGTAGALSLHNLTLNDVLDTQNTNLTVTGNLTIANDAASVISSGTGTLIFSGTNTQELTTTAATQDDIDVPVTVNKSGGALTLQNNLVLDEAGQTLAVTDGEIDLNGSDISVATSFTFAAAGSLRLEGDETVSPNPTFADDSLVTFDGVAGPYTIPSWSYPSITFAGATTYNLPAAPSIAGGITTAVGSTVISGVSGFFIDSLTNAGTFTAPNAETLTITDFVTNTGTFNGNNGTVQFLNTATSSNGTITFYNLKIADTVNDSTSVTHTFEAGQIVTVANELILDGLDANDRVVLVSDNPGTQWGLNPQATRTIDFITVTDSSNLNGSAIACATNNCTDGGNNTNWEFVAGQINSSGGGGSSAFGLLQLGLETNSEASQTATGDAPVVNASPEFVKLTDVIDHWAYYYIKELFDAGIMKGRNENEFAPNAQMTRAEFLKVALLAYGHTIPADAAEKALDLGFADLREGQWYLGYMYVANTKGFVQGFEDNGERRLRPNNPITRAEALTILARIAEWDLTDSMQNQTEFPDVKQGDWYYEVVKEAVGLGIISGYENGNFGPRDQLLRAQAAKIIANLI